MPESVFTQTMPSLLAGGVCCCAVEAGLAGVEEADEFDGVGIAVGVALVVAGAPAGELAELNLRPECSPRRCPPISWSGTSSCYRYLGRRWRRRLPRCPGTFWRGTFSLWRRKSLPPPSCPRPQPAFSTGSSSWESRLRRPKRS